ncbi:unnamed protein product [Ectocarpus sp. 13 AM-2016]
MLRTTQPSGLASGCDCRPLSIHVSCILLFKLVGCICSLCVSCSRKKLDLSIHLLSPSLLLPLSLASAFPSTYRVSPCLHFLSFRPIPRIAHIVPPSS